MVAFIIALLVGFMVIYSIDPSLLGFEPKRTEADSLKIEKEKKLMPKLNKYIISEKQFQNMLSQIEKLNKLVKDKENQLADLNSKKDSLYSDLHRKEELIKQKEKLIDTITAYKNVIQERNTEISQYKDSINQLNKKLENIKKELLSKDEKIVQMEKSFNRQIDSLKVENFRQFSEMFKSSQPREIARILELIDEKDAAKILKMLPKKQAGKIIEALPPDRAAVIMLLGSGQ